MRMFSHLVDEGGQGLVGEVAFELVPATDLAAGATFFKVQEGAQGTEDVVSDGALPTHEEAADMADFLERMVVALDLPLQAADVLEVAVRDLHALFLCGSLWA